MAPTARFELRLDDSMITQIDAWRADQQNVPSRSAAVRTLIQAGMSNGDSEQLFELARFQLLIAASTPSLKKKLPPAYVYAWDEGVYPLFHDGHHLHRPFASSFRVGKSMVEELTDYLDRCDRQQKIPTFYELEDYYEVRYGNTDWDRISLMQVCRYMYLNNNMFGDLFWQRILAKMEHPAEANSIIRTYDFDKDMYLS